MNDTEVAALLDALTSHGVDFLMIGGYAVAAHGVLRATKDLDIVPRPSRENFERLQKAVESADGEPILKGDDFDVAEMPMQFSPEALIEGGGNWALETRFGQLDVLQNVEPEKPYSELYSRSMEIDVPGVSEKVHVVGYDDLIAMKTAAARPRDLTDVADLERARGN